MNVTNINKKNVDYSVLDFMQKSTPYTKEFLELVIKMGLDTPIKLRQFLHPRVINLSNPFIINDMEKAVIRTKKAIREKEKIFIYGDKDVDGQSSISLLLLNLKDYHLDTIYYIPDNEGYGVHKSILKLLIEKGIQLFITVDCGISNKEELEFLQSNGIDAIVLDHHEAIGEIPVIQATVDPKIITKYYKEKNLTIKNLAGCGVVFYFLWALKIGFSDYFNKFFSFFKIFIDEAEDILKIEVEISVMKNGLIIRKIFLTNLNENKNHVENEKVTSEEDFVLKFLKFLSLENISFFVFFDKESLEKLFRYEKLKLFFKDKNIIYINDIYLKLYGEKCLNINSFYERINFYNSYDSYTDGLAEFYWNLLFINDFSIRYFFKKYLSFVSLGTISDIMPLCGENRFLTKYGIMRLKENILGIKFLIDFNDKEKLLTAKYVSWNITPFLNSAGRMSRPELGVDFLCSKDKNQIFSLKEKIDELNNNRRELQRRDERLADKILKLKYHNDENKKFIFVNSSSFEKNLTGLVASNLMKKYFKVTFVLSEDGEKVTGSVRAPKKFSYNVVDILNMCQDVLERFGGHKLAGGFTVKKENIEIFEKKLSDIFANLDEKTNINKEFVKVSLSINCQDITNKFMSEVFLLEPFGEGNNNPIFLLENVKFLEYGFIGSKKEHFKGKILTKDNYYVDILGWNKHKEIEKCLQEKKILNFLVSVERDNFKNEKNFRLNIHDVVYE